jgi:hypothetical protein
VIKKFLKKHALKYNFIITKLLYIYLKITYFTSRWQFVFAYGYNKQIFLAQKRTIFALWHNRLAFGPGIFASHKDIYALISPHSDGRIIGDIVNQFGFGVINGSTNKDPVIALRTIVKKLHNNSNIVITPDGPRGPIYKINSTINKIAWKYNIQLVPISCSSSKYFSFKSWDRLMFPLPFGRITVRVGLPLTLSGDEHQDNVNLEQVLKELNDND